MNQYVTPIRGAVAALLLFCAAGSAQPPKVPGKVLAGPGGRAVVEIEIPAGKTVAWKAAFADEDCFLDELKPLRADTVRLIVLPSKAGVYRVVLWSGLAAGDSAVLVIDATDGKAPEPKPKPDPEPEPEPKPQPKPDDNPLKSAAWLIVVEETAQRTPETAKVLGDLNYWEGLETKGFKRKFYDKDSAEAKAKNYPAMVAGTDLPALLVLDASGKKLTAVKLPKSTAEIDSLLKGGK